MGAQHPPQRGGGGDGEGDRDAATPRIIFPSYRDPIPSRPRMEYSVQGTLTSPELHSACVIIMPPCSYPKIDIGPGICR